jgi:tRNA pseudouridine13 synthase
VKIKQRPEDFTVRESYRFNAVARGKFGVYVMDKQKLSTFEAVEVIRRRFGLRPDAISFCGLKDKQGRTEQLIAIEGPEVSLQEPKLRLKYLGRTDSPLSAKNTTSNRFSVTVRALRQSDLPPLDRAVAEVSRLGVVNYFDSQRFGSLKHGQGFIAKDLIRGNFEDALRRYMAVPSPLDHSEDAKVKRFWQERWGDWRAFVPYPGHRYTRIIRALREEPKDFVNAFLQIDRSYRAMLLFTYQSYLWNEGVRRLFQLLLPREYLFPHPYQAGTLLFHQDAPAEVLKYLRSATFPLLAPETVYRDDRVRQAAEWALAKQKLTLDALRIAKAPGRLYFKHEERPILIWPRRLTLGRPSPDRLNAGCLKLNVAFTLPPGSYATLVVRRLFHFCYREDSGTGDQASHTQVRENSRPASISN